STASSPEPGPSASSRRFGRRSPLIAIAPTAELARVTFPTQKAVVPMAGANEQRALSPRSPVEVVGDGVEGHASAEYMLELGLDRLHAHLRVGPSQNNHD